MATASAGVDLVVDRTTLLTSLALGVQETGSLQSITRTIPPTNYVSTVSEPSTISVAKGDTPGSGSGRTTALITASTTLASRTTKNQATDEALSDFDLADLWV